MNAVYMSELSPRTAARNADMTFDFDSAKLLPYVMLNDDHDGIPAVKNVDPFSIDEDGKALYLSGVPQISLTVMH